MKLYTKAGDEGETSLGSGKRLKKTDSRIKAIGEVDELNSFLGLARCHCKERNEDVLLAGVQRDLFAIGAELAQVKEMKLEKKEVEKLESAIDAASEKLTPLQSFVLPGGSKCASHLHVCRSICRRVERSVLALKEKEEVNENIPVYLNRLSDLFFALARKANKSENVEEFQWKAH